MATPEEIRAKMAANLEAITKAAEAAEAVKAAKTAEGDASKVAEAAKSAKEACYKEAATLASKAIKAVGALHENVSKAEGIDKEHKSAVAEAHKAMGAAHKALGGKEEAEDEKKESEKAALSEAMKAIGALQAKLDTLEKAAFQPKGGGPGAGLVTATKTGVVAGEAAAVSAKKPEDMTPAEREVARKAAFTASRAYALPADVFDKTGTDALKAMDAMAQEALAEEAAKVEA